MNMQLRIRRMVDNCQGVFANRIFIIPIQGPHMKSLSILGSLVPDTSDCAGSLDEFREKVQSQDIFFFDLSCSTLSNTFDLLEVTLVGVSFSNSDIQVKNSLQKTLHSTGQLGSEEGWKFFLQNLFQLAHVVTIEKVQGIMDLLGIKLSQSFSHLSWGSLKVGYVKIVTLRISGVANQQLLAIRDLSDQSWGLINQLFRVFNKIAAQDQGDQHCEDCGLQHNWRLMIKIH